MTLLSHFPGDVKAGTGNRTLVQRGGSGGFMRFPEGSVWVGLGRSGPVWKKKEKEEEKEKEKGKEEAVWYAKVNPLGGMAAVRGILINKEVYAIR